MNTAGRVVPLALPALLLACGVALLAGTACGGAVEEPAPPHRVFEPAFDPPAPGASTYSDELGARASIAQRTVFVGWYNLSNVDLGFHPACPTAGPSGHLEVGRFRIMTHEVTKRAYKRCIAEGRCPARASDTDSGDPVRVPWDAPSRELEPVAASPANAETFCRAYGGELPTLGQWHAAAGATQTELATPWVSHRMPQCFADSSQANCLDFEASAEVPRRAGHSPVPLRRVGTTPWDVSPEGAFDLYGNASEWLRPPSVDLPTGGCDGPALMDAAYYRGPRTATDRRVNLAAPALGFVFAWLNYDGAVAEAGAGRLLETISVWMFLRETPEKTDYRSGFRCVFPEEKP